jgi:DnaK suppressor protein
MANTDWTFYREGLLALRARLQGDTTQMADGALNKDYSQTTGMPTDMADVGSDNFERELTLGLLGSDNDVIEQIDRALKRIEDGSFGQCEECREQIPKKRLDAIPYAARCVQCASQLEEGHGP